MIQRRARVPSVPNSSPRTASPGPRRVEPVADQLLGRVVGLGDRGEVGLGLHLEVVRAEAAERDLVGEGRELEGEGEIGVDAATLAGRCHAPRATRAACWTAIAGGVLAPIPVRRSSCSPASSRSALDRVRRRRLRQGEQAASVRRPRRRRARPRPTVPARPARPRRRRSRRLRRTTTPAPVGTCGEPDRRDRRGDRGQRSQGLDARAGPVHGAELPARGVVADLGRGRDRAQPRRRSSTGRPSCCSASARCGTSMDVGTSGVGCDTLPANVQSDLGLICSG